MYLFEEAGIPVLLVHLMKAEILASKCQIMQFSFEYTKKTSKLNQQTHFEVNGKQVRLFEKQEKSPSIFSHHHSRLCYLLLYH